MIIYQKEIGNWRKRKRKQRGGERQMTKFSLVPRRQKLASDCPWVALPAGPLDNRCLHDIEKSEE